MTDMARSVLRRVSVATTVLRGKIPSEVGNIELCVRQVIRNVGTICDAVAHGERYWVVVGSLPASLTPAIRNRYPRGTRWGVVTRRIPCGVRYQSDFLGCWALSRG